MLVLTRRPGERIFIGPDICITITEIDRGTVRARVGIDAPPDVAIHREEIAPADHPLKAKAPAGG